MFSGTVGLFNKKSNKRIKKEETKTALASNRNDKWRATQKCPEATICARVCDGRSAVHGTGIVIDGDDWNCGISWIFHLSSSPRTSKGLVLDKVFAHKPASHTAYTIEHLFRYYFRSHCIFAAQIVCCSRKHRHIHSKFVYNSPDKRNTHSQWKQRENESSNRSVYMVIYSLTTSIAHSIQLSVFSSFVLSFSDKSMRMGWSFQPNRHLHFYGVRLRIWFLRCLFSWQTFAPWNMFETGHDIHINHIYT